MSLKMFGGVFSNSQIKVPYLDIDGRDIVWAFAIILISQITSLFLAYGISNREASTCLGCAITTYDLMISSLLVFFLCKRGMSLVFKINKQLVKQSARYLCLILPIIIFTEFAVKCVMQVQDYPEFHQEIEQLFPIYGMDIPVFYLFLFSIVVLAPIAEEILFRGIFQNYLAKYTGTFFGILVSSTIFTLLHCDFSQGIANIQILVPSLILSYSVGYYFQKTGSLIPCILIHSAVNLVAMISMLYDKVFS